MTTPPTSLAARKRKVLIVDDSIDLAESLAALLESEGFETTTANSGPEAILQVSRTWPDAVLLDIGMPGMNGIQVARELIARGTADRVRLIALTGYGGDSDRLATTEAGFHSHLEKPVDLDVLLKALREPFPGASLS